jgi:hypothetical protein
MAIAPREAHRFRSHEGRGSNEPSGDPRNGLDVVARMIHLGLMAFGVLALLT